MAVTVTPLYARGSVQSFEVEATADTDVAAVITHSLPVASAADAAERVRVDWTPSQVEAHLKQWRTNGGGANTVNLGATGAVGSGVAGPQLTVNLTIRRAGSERPGL